MTGSSRAYEIATELAALTKARAGYSSFIRELGDVAKEDMTKAAATYQSLTMWGGMGSFADEAAAEGTAEEKARVIELLVDFYEEFERHGVHDDRASSWADVFRWWRDEDVFRKIKS